MSSEWKERNRPARLERQYKFSNYEELRDFLDRAADLSESAGYYPDMGFGRDYVNVTIHAEEGETTLDDSRYQFAKNLMNCLAKTRTEENATCPLLL